MLIQKLSSLFLWVLASRTVKNTAGQSLGQVYHTAGKLFSSQASELRARNASAGLNQQDDPGNPVGPWSVTGTAGAGGGTPFHAQSFDLSQGRANLVSRIEVWSDKYCLRGMQLTFSDGSVQGPFGRTVGDSASYDFAPGERLEELSVWFNADGTRAGRMKFQTSKAGSGNTFDVGSNTGKQTEISLTGNLASGLIIGVYGHCGLDIDYFGFYVVDSPIASIQYSDMRYSPDIVNTPAGMKLNTIKTTHFTNTWTNDQAYDFHDTPSTSVSSTYTLGVVTTFGLSETVSLSGEVFGIKAESDTTASWQTSFSETYSSTTTSTSSLNYGISGIMHPGQSLTCVATYFSGELSLTYNGLVNMTLKNGEWWTWRESGNYRQVAASAAYAQCN